jgi:hypothetical protein
MVLDLEMGMLTPVKIYAPFDKSLARQVIGADELIKTDNSMKKV